MKNSIRGALPLAVAVLFLGGADAAWADDSNVVLYGVLDTAVAYIQHALNFDADHPVANNPTVTKGTQPATGLLNGGMSATRWGIKGQEDMGGGLKAVFTLESAFNIPSGELSNAARAMAYNTSTGPAMSADSAISGQFFSRGAFVGLSSTSWGTLTAGRQQSFFLDNIVAFDAILGSQAFSPLGFSGTYGGGGFTDDSRVDNSLKYVVPVGDFTLGALYKFGGVSGSTSARSAYELNGVYASGPLAVQLGYEAFKDALSLTNATGTGTLKATAADTKSYMLSARYTLDQTTLRAGFEREEFNNPSNPLSDQQITSVFGFGLAAAPSVTAYDNQKTLNVFWLGVQEEFSPGFSVLVGAYHVAQNAFDCPKASASGCSGSLNYYSIAADYKFSKRTDSYLGFMESTVSGGPANALIITGTKPAETSNRIFGLGLRHRF